ncbi:hypothetical protein [Methylobacterium planeticum]|nr:hypothetical protein [Methylobacterium planeticum]
MQGLVFETSDGRILNAEEAISYARSVEAQWPAFKAVLDAKVSPQP